MNGISLRPAVGADWECLAAATETCIRKYAELTWGNWIPETRDSFRPEIHQVIQCDGESIGAMALVDELDALSLEKLYILPEHQGKGIGTFLLKHCIEQADAGRVLPIAGACGRAPHAVCMKQ
jgi:GNAT superfamily N-acetyltransferase